MAERVRPSVAKQEALMRLMSSDPSLIGSLDDDLLASITLASEPADARALSATAAISSRKGKAHTAAAPTTRLTLLDPRLSLDIAFPSSTTSSSSSSSSSECQPAAPPPVRRAKVQLYTQAPDAAPSSSRATKKHVLLHSVSAPEPGSSANDPRRRTNGATRESPGRPPQRLLSLLDDSVFAAHGDLKATSKPSKSTVVQQSPLPPSVSSSRTGAATSRSTKAKTNNRRSPQVPLPPALRSVEQQYEFGGGYALRSSLSDSPAAMPDADDSDAADQSAIESTHSSSHGSNDSDESCISASSASMQDTGGSSHSTRTGALIDLPPPLTSARAKPSTLVMDHRCFVARDQWVPKSSRKSCSVCERDFNVLRKRHSCRMCGEVICSRCSVFRAVNLSVVEGKCRICSCCSVSYRKKLDELATGAPDAAPSPPSADAIDASASVSAPSPPLTASSLSTLLKSGAPILADSENACDDDECAKASYDSDLSTLLSGGDCSFSSPSISCASDVSLASFASSSSSSRNIEAELEAALKARQLEKEVEASRSRIRELEVTIAEQENQQERLSTEQQAQLTEARRVISLLQAQLEQQEVSAREAAATRDTICLTNLRQAEVYATDDDESRALKKKLKVLERQLQLAGINVAEVIPYDVAKAKVAEIARRLQEIGSSELVLDDKLAQAAVRKEYYKLEQDMEKYNTALVMTDEYIEEERRRETAFEDAHCAANAAALALLRSAIPVEISRLSEQQLKQLVTPSGAAFPPELAKRLKRTNVLQLVRVDPSDIVRMHPSVIEGFRTTGLTLLERRALHVVMQTPFREWKRQQMDEMSQKKFQWYKKLRDALVSAVASYEQHCASAEAAPSADAIDPTPLLSNAPAHACKLLGLSCPVRAEARVEALYATGLGFPATDVYFVQEVIKSDPDGAGEKALQEAQSYAREVVANQRQRDLKTHYRMRMRDVAMAMGALEEIDAALERLETLDAPCALPPESGDSRDAADEHALTTACESIVQTARELVLLLAKRAGICVVGKRTAANDEADTRSRLECQSAARAAAVVSSMLDDVQAFYARARASGSALGALRFVRELLDDVQEKNRAHAAAQGESSELQDETSDSSRSKRVPWSERQRPSAVGASSAAECSEDAVRIAAPQSRPSPAAVLPTSASLFDAIRARKQQQQQRAASEGDERRSAPTSSAESASAPVAKPPLDLFAAIRARQAKLASPAASTWSA